MPTPTLFLIESDLKTAACGQRFEQVSNLDGFMFLVLGHGENVEPSCYLESHLERLGPVQRCRGTNSMQPTIKIAVNYD